ncbi:hypothetical protein TNIN_22511 [Trichonephila inaurata madagascariensis]|uniref:SCAN domain-containing protein n=1 Tax=Trichonephila inaurata madagascariensis TaxID=2747483 RepID=A0A8X7BRA5_9ARAC|nr:hypothetical protein TNIN_22511 [Trichonephila inaurata madagascariensis]
MRFFKITVPNVVGYLNQQDHNITSTPQGLPVISLKNNNDISKYLLVPELLDYNASTSKDLPALELIDYSASSSKDQLVPEFINYTASISYDLSMDKSKNNNTLVSYDQPAANLPTKKALNLEYLQKIKSFSLSTIGQLETVNNSTSTPASTVKTSVVLLASEWKAAVSDSKTCCVLCGIESTGAHSCNICKNQMPAICGNTVGEEGYMDRKFYAIYVKYQRENAAKHLRRSAEKMKEVSLKKFKDLSLSTVLANVPKVDRGPLNGNNIVDNMM